MTHVSSTTSLLSGSISGPLCKHNCKCSKINEMKVNYTFNNIVLTFFKATIVAFLDISSLKNKNRIWKWQILMIFLYFFSSVQVPVAYFCCHVKLLKKVQSFNKITIFVWQWITTFFTFSIIELFPNLTKYKHAYCIYYL